MAQLASRLALLHASTQDSVTQGLNMEENAFADQLSRIAVQFPLLVIATWFALEIALSFVVVRIV